MGSKLKFRKFYPTRPEGAEALSPGQCTQSARPEGAEALSPGQCTQSARPEGAEALSPGQWNKQHALKGQKLSAQDNGTSSTP